MRPFENVSFMQLIDILALATEKYTKILKDNRNSDEHELIRSEIHQLIAEIDLRKSDRQTTDTNSGLPEITIY
jgi:hypothetical protein